MQKIKNKKKSIYFIFAIFLIIIFSPNSGQTEDMKKIFERFIDTGSVIVTDCDNKIILEYDADKQMIPASTIKILTSYFILQKLGNDYKFFTDIYYANTTRDIYVKGYGDPYMVTEEIQKLADLISSKIKVVNNIYVDDFFFENNIMVSGRLDSFNPYDAPLCALSANFNSISVEYRDGEYFPLEGSLLLNEPVLRYLRKSGFTGSDRVNFSNDKKLPPIYFGEVLKKCLTLKKIKVNGVIERKKVENPALLFRFYNSNNLEQILIKMLKFSNNFMVNQIFMHIGTLEYGFPGNMNKSIYSFNTFIRPYNILKNVRIDEASGLSRNNRISAIELNYVLSLFDGYKNFLPERDGGYFKTGSLSDVSAIAGYYNSKKFGEVKIVILLNQKKNNRGILLQKVQSFLDGK